MTWRVLIRERAGKGSADLRPLGWLARPPWDAAGSWQIVTDPAAAGEWPTKAEAGQVEWQYRRGQSWRGRFPMTEPAGDPAEDLSPRH